MFKDGSISQDGDEDEPALRVVRKAQPSSKIERRWLSPDEARSCLPRGE